MKTPSEIVDYIRSMSDPGDFFASDDDCIEALTAYAKEESEREKKEYEASLSIGTHKINEQADRISELEAEIERLIIRANQAESKVVPLEAENAELKSEIGNIYSSNNYMKLKKIKRLEAENAELKKSAEKQSAWIEDHWYVEANYPIDKAYSNALKKIKRLEAELAEARNETGWSKVADKELEIHRLLADIKAKDSHLKLAVEALEIVKDKWKDCSDSCLSELSDVATKALEEIRGKG